MKQSINDPDNPLEYFTIFYHPSECDKVFIGFGKRVYDSTGLPGPGIGSSLHCYMFDKETILPFLKECVKSLEETE